MINSAPPRTYWITGATSGIGRALAERLIARGERIIITARNEDALHTLRRLAVDRVQIIQADLADSEAGEYLHSQLAGITDSLDTVILNAGNCEYLDVDDFDMALIERVMEINFFGFTRCVQASLPLLRKSDRRPHLVGISSASVFFGLPRAQAYGASKAAMSHFLDALRVDLFSRGIAVSSVYPGFVDTPLTRKNDFPMPWIMDSEVAAKRILDGIDKRKHHIAFPSPLIFSLKLLAALPSAVAVRIVQKAVRNKEGA